jgi:hypothetical protein
MFDGNAAVTFDEMNAPTGIDSAQGRTYAMTNSTPAGLPDADW